MKLYLAHASTFDFLNELYQPIKSHAMWHLHDVILPHDAGSQLTNSKSIIKNADVLLAEVSYPSLGLGIELGWAAMLETPIIAFYKNGFEPSASVHIVTDCVNRYTSPTELPDLIIESLQAIGS